MDIYVQLHFSTEWGILVFFHVFNILLGKAFWEDLVGRGVFPKSKSFYMVVGIAEGALPCHCPQFVQFLTSIPPGWIQPV